ncbi:MAG: hypothetical protein M0R03_22355, partial [Novosphingobium sp.]|nr:hypothetical protein [Novosphingobium sp.]
NLLNGFNDGIHSSSGVGGVKPQFNSIKKAMRPVLEPKKRTAKDPIRYPKVIEPIEDRSKRTFTTYLQMEQKMLVNEINKES